MIEDNIKAINERISIAAQKSGRSREDITLIAVSKINGVSEIKRAQSCGVCSFGENKVQEFLGKQSHLPGLDWHFIGHLQTNKVKYIVGKVGLIHSLDSAKLAKELNRHAKAQNIVCNVLVQINISGEATKFGISRSELQGLLEQVQNLDNIRVCGLMTMTPFAASEVQVKNLYEKCNNLFVDIKGKKYHNIYMESLSMGMTGDFEAAIECGANVVRIGTGIFGKRN